MSVTAINEVSPLNRIESEIFFLIELNGVGFLNAQSDWEFRIQSGFWIETDNFIQGVPALFDEIPMGVLERIHPNLRPNIHVLRKHSTHIVEEIVI